jgi:hypothetical protein
LNTQPDTAPSKQSESIADWLDAREPAAPPSLRARIDVAIKSVPDAGSSIAATLGEAAVVALRGAVARCEERSAAIDLLAADALLTYMMEAAAEQGPDAIEAAADAYGNARLAQIAANAEVA